MSAHHDEPGASGHVIHVPEPSFSPALIGLAVMLLAFGILFGAPLLVAGGICFVIGLATWLVDDARQNYSRAPESDHGNGGHGGAHQ